MFLSQLDWNKKQVQVEGEMIEVANEVVLFSFQQDGERFRVACVRGPDGSLGLCEASRGPWTRWCYGSESHRRRLMMSASTVERLCREWGAAGAGQLACVLAVRFTGFACLSEVQRHLDEKKLSYTLVGDEV